MLVDHTSSRTRLVENIGGIDIRSSKEPPVVIKPEPEIEDSDDPINRSQELNQTQMSNDLTVSSLRKSTRNKVSPVWRKDYIM